MKEEWKWGNEDDRCGDARRTLIHENVIKG
jgi:hypothetical protein